jgi:hypothetical protein
MRFAVVLVAAIGACDPADDDENDIAPGDYVELGDEPVSCDALQCPGGQICVRPAWDCDYSGCSDGEDAEWIVPAPACAPIPAECADEHDRHRLSACLSAAHCGGPDAYNFFHSDTRDLQCLEAEDCFCG